MNTTAQRTLPQMFEKSVVKYSTNILMWEKKGLQAHRDAGLPSSRELLYRVFQWLSDPAPATVKEQNARTLCAQVLQVFVERFAWDGQAKR